MDANPENNAQVDLTQADLIIFTADHPEGLRFVGGDNGLDDAWEMAEEMLLPRRKDRIKWDAAKELIRGR